MNDESGPDGGAYLAQHLDVAAAVAERVTDDDRSRHGHELVFCSRSGSPRTPWLEPDVNDRLEELAAEGVGAVVLVPVGFVSDHMEVVYDLDTEALATAGEAGHRGPSGRDRGRRPAVRGRAARAGAGPADRGLPGALLPAADLGSVNVLPRGARRAGAAGRAGGCRR